MPSIVSCTYTSRITLELQYRQGSNGGEPKIAKFLIRYKSTGTILTRPGIGRRSKITQQVKELVEAQMRLDDETTAAQTSHQQWTRNVL